MHGMIRTISIALVLSLVAGFGCAKKTTTTGPSAEDLAKMEQKKKNELAGLGSKDGMKGKLMGADAETLAEAIYFDFDSSALKPASVKVLDKKVELLKKVADVKVTVEGSCDPRGTEEYNMALGERRAKSAYSYLTKAGVSASRLSAVSLGESKATGTNEAGWAKDRRADFKQAM